MRLVRYFILFLLLSTEVALAASGQGQPFSVTLHQPPGPIKTGSEVRVMVTTTNTSDHEIRFAKGFGEEDTDFEIEVRDAHGKTPPLTGWYRDLKEHSRSRWGSYSTYVLEPGKSFEDALVVTKLYVLTQPGEYKISVKRGQRPLWQTQGKGGVTSNSVAVTLIP